MSLLAERVEPFRPLLYDRRFAPSLAAMVAPPYDLIAPDRQAQLYDRSPYNIVRLELNRDADRYDSSARLLHRWLDERVLVRAEKPAVYLYTQRFRHEGRVLAREGFVVRFRLEEFSRGRVLPHERTFPAAKEDRLRLLTATETNLSSIFGLYSGAHPELHSLREKVASRDPIAQVTDDLGIENRLCAIEAEVEIATIQSALSEARVLIADGHHRYETALEYRRRRRAADGDPAALKPYDYIMMTLVACDDPGLVILPTHRVVHRLPGAAMESFVARAGELFTLESFTDRAQFRARLAEAGRGALGVALAGRDALYVLRLKNESAITPQLAALPEEVRRLERLDSARAGVRFDLRDRRRGDQSGRQYRVHDRRRRRARRGRRRQSRRRVPDESTLDSRCRARQRRRRHDAREVDLFLSQAVDRPVVESALRLAVATRP